MMTLQVTIRTFLRSTWKERIPNTDWSRDCMEQRWLNEWILTRVSGIHPDFVGRMTSSPT